MGAVQEKRVQPGDAGGVADQLAGYAVSVNPIGAYQATDGGIHPKGRVGILFESQHRHDCRHFAGGCEHHDGIERVVAKCRLMQYAGGVYENIADAIKYGAFVEKLIEPLINGRKVCSAATVIRRRLGRQIALQLIEQALKNLRRARQCSRRDHERCQQSS